MANMENFLNSIEIPNGVGFEIYPNTMPFLFKTKALFQSFGLEAEKIFQKVLIKYDLPVFFPLEFSLSVESCNGEKHICLSKLFFIDTICKCFNRQLPEELNDFFSMVSSGYSNHAFMRNEFLSSNLKNITKGIIKELNETKTVEDFRNVSNYLYQVLIALAKKRNIDNLKFQKFFLHFRDDLIKQLKKIIIWSDKILDDISIPLENELFRYVDIDKFKMYFSFLYLHNSQFVKSPYNLILYDSALKIVDSIENKDVKIQSIYIFSFFKSLDKSLIIDNANIKKFNELLNYYKNRSNIGPTNLLENYSRGDFSGKTIDEILAFISKEIEKTIKKSTELGSENVDTNEMNSKIDELDKKIKSGKLVGKDLLKAKHQLQKLHMVMKEVIPRAIHKGLPPFKGFYVYFYDNGMVAIDKIDYGSRLFVMPVSTYKYILDNKIDRLRKAGRLDSVKAYKHDERTDWLGKAKQDILNSTEYVTEADKKYNEQIDGWNFGYTQEDIDKIKNTIESIEKDVSLTSNEKDKIKKEIEEKAKKKRKKKQKANEIDSELKQSNPKSEEEMTKKDNDELANLESKLDDEFGNDSDFDELYEAEKKYKKNGNRCASVSKFGKDRTIDENGMYHCEMCNTTYSIEQKSRLDYHHFIPISKGGPDTLYNGICLCTECHRIIHYEKERIPISTQGYILSLIEKHIREENPELLDKFIEYKNYFFPDINELISNERNRLKKQGLSESMIDIIIEEKEELLLNDPKKYVKGFELRYHK